MKTITIVLQDDGNVGIIPGGEISPAMGLAACRAATEYYQNSLVEARVANLVEEFKHERDLELLETKKEESADAE